MITKQLKSIRFEVGYDGKGLINADSSEQGWTLRHKGIMPKGAYVKNGSLVNNIMYAKKNFEDDVDENGKDVSRFRYKISGDSLRHAIYKEEMPFYNENIMQLPHVLIHAIATPALMTRGYLYIPTGRSPLTKTSVLHITDAEEVGRAHTIVDFDIHSKSVKKESNNVNDSMDDDSDDMKNETKTKSATSLFYTENVGHHKYVATGSIDLQELQFISGDKSYGRCAIDQNMLSMYMEALKRNLTHDNFQHGYYYMGNSYTQDEWAEEGILLSQDNVDELAKYLLRNIYNMTILRRTAELRVDYLKLIFDDGEEYVIKSVSDIDNFRFEVIGKYRAADDALIKANYAKMEEINKIAKETNVKRVQEKKDKKAKKAKDDESEQ